MDFLKFIQSRRINQSWHLEMLSTNLIIPLFPLLQNRLINRDGIVANSMSGISGAGRNASELLLRKK